MAPTPYTVRQGDWLWKIARREGFTAQRLEELPENREFFARPDRTRNRIYPGDIIYIPEKDKTPARSPTNQRVAAVIRLDKLYFPIRLLDSKNQPLANYRYKLDFLRSPETRGDLTFEGTTDGDGFFEVEVPEIAYGRDGTLVVETPNAQPRKDARPYLPSDREWTVTLRVGSLDPISTLTGVHARLKNLGYYFGPIEARYGPSTRLAIHEFEVDHVPQLERAKADEMDALIDARTLTKLYSVHDNITVQEFPFADDEAGRGPGASVHDRVYRVAPNDLAGAPERNTLRLYPAPDLLLDAHMHIQSANCTPLPLAWHHAPWGLRDVQRSTMNWRASWTDFGEVVAQDTNQIADNAVQRNRATYADVQTHPLMNPEPEDPRLSPMIVLPMDQDLAHVDGYLGEPIHYKVATKRYRQGRLWGVRGDPLAPPLPRYLHLDGTPITPQERTDAEAQQLERLGLAADDIVIRRYREEHNEDGFYYYYLAYTLPEENDDDGGEATVPNPLALPDRPYTLLWLEDEEHDLYEDFREQRSLTTQSAARHPWSLLPLFHYEPRRWQRGGKKNRVTPYTGNWQVPFEEIATESNQAPYIGFKMYTPLGYKPTDFQWLPHFEDYFRKCQSDKIPILNHCTPGGFYTHERHFYIDLDNVDMTSPAFLARYGGLPEGNERRIEWFRDHFISPVAWYPLMQRFPQLHLCLAHFVGDDWDVLTGAIGPGGDAAAAYDAWWADPNEGRWLKGILRLINEFDNVYTDVSFFYVDEHEAAFTEVLRRHPKLKRRMNFGTDWYLTMIPGDDEREYNEFCAALRPAIDRAGRAVFPKDPIPLWLRMTRENPLRCYRLLDIAENLAAGMKRENQRVAGLPANERPDDWDAAANEQRIDDGLVALLRNRPLDTE